MDSDALSDIVRRLDLRAGIFVDAEYCGNWAVDTSGSKMATFHLVQDGDCWLLLDGAQPRRVMPGDFVFFPRDARHVMSPCVEPPADVQINVAASPGELAPPDGPPPPSTRMLCGYFEFLSQARWPLLDALPDVVVLAAGSDSSGVVEGADGAQARVLIDLILAECRVAGPGRLAALEQLSYLLFIQILRQVFADGQQTGLLAALADPHVGAALGCMHSRPQHPWRLETLAREVGMSRSAFATRFKELVGQSAMQYLLAWRMQVAVDLLSSSDTSMVSIAEAVGYASEAAFRNAFSKHIGRPPARVRRDARAQSVGDPVPA